MTTAVIGAVAALAGAATPARATFPGINGRVAVFSRPALNISTFQLSGDEGGPLAQTLSTPSGQREFDPAWSPDGDRLAFARYVDGQSDIWVADADGTNARMLIGGPGDDYDPTWSVDGRIAFTSTRGGDIDLYVANAEGSVQTRLTDAPGVNQQADWSPVRGGPIAFESTRDGNYELYTIRPDGTGEARVTTDPGRDSDPAWSPDGRQLAFIAAAPGAMTSSVYAISSTGSDRRGLSAPGIYWNTTPAWSPDGRKIAFSALIGSGYYLFVMDGNGANPSASLGPGFDPVWARLPPAPTPASTALPTTGETAFARPVGKVQIRPTGADVDSGLPRGGLEIPDGSRLDTTAPNSAVTLVTALPDKRTTNIVTASQGAFRFTQGPSPLTTMTVNGARCPGARRGIHRGRLRVRTRPPAAGADAQQARTGPGEAARRKRRTTRVKGNYSHASSTYTDWTTIDRCSSTTTIVHEGKVEVRDLVRRKTVSVRAGKRYVARKRLEQ